MSSWPWALFMFSALTILRISSSLKLIELSLDWVKNIWFTGSTLLFFRGVHCSAKNLLKIFAFIWVSVTYLSSIKLVLKSLVKIELIFNRFNPFNVNGLFLYPWKQRISGFLMFSGCIKRDQWHEMNYCHYSHHIETTWLICNASQLTLFYAMKGWS